MTPSELIGWASSCSEIVLSIAMIAVGAAVVRPGRPTAGWLVVAAGAINMLSVCCFEALGRASGSSGDPMVMSVVTRMLSIVTLIVSMGLTIAGVAMLGGKPPEAGSTDSRPPMA